MKMLTTLTFHNAYKPHAVDTKPIIKVASKIGVDFQVLVKSSVNIIFCSDFIIRKLNRTYRSKDSTTDVLSFPFLEPDFLGEIYISVDRVKVQARKYGFTFEEEMRRMVVHGIFHLLGYDHLSEKERITMEKLEKKYHCLDV